MATELLPISSTAPEPDRVARAAQVLRRGGLVAFPTETVYGLGALALDAAAVERIFVAKGRPPSNPVIVHVASAPAARELVRDWPETAELLAARFWPGPLTLVLPRRAVVPDIVTAGGPTVALRVPAHPVALALIQSAGLPIAAPSANQSTQLSPTRAEHVLAGLAGRIDLVLDGGPTPGGLESTVLDVTGSPPRLLRPGLLAPAQLEAVIGPIDRRTPESVNDVALPSPGLMARHYAPRTPLECVADAGLRVAELCHSGARVGCLTFAGPTLPELPGLNVLLLPPEPVAYAAGLYAALHALDAAGLDWIVVSLPPDTEDWLTVRDRLRRAATPA